MSNHKPSKPSDAPSDQDTPGRPKASGSRQQTQPDQGVQSGSPEVDAKAKGKPKSAHHVRNEK